jgi:hypothetical protein
MEKNYEKNKKSKIRPEYEDENKKDYKEKIITEISIDKTKITKQKSLTIEGIEVFFPYHPYDSQILYMTKGKKT